MCNARKNLSAIMPILSGDFAHYLKNAWMVDLIGRLKQVLRDSIDFLRTLENIQRVDASMPQYALRKETAGIEKNLLACTVSGEAQILFFNISGAEFIHLYVGRTVRQNAQSFGTVMGSAME